LISFRPNLLSGTKSHEKGYQAAISLLYGICGSKILIEEAVLLGQGEIMTDRLGNAEMNAN